MEATKNLLKKNVLMLHKNNEITDLGYEIAREIFFNESSDYVYDKYLPQLKENKFNVYAIKDTLNLISDSATWETITERKSPELTDLFMSVFFIRLTKNN